MQQREAAAAAATAHYREMAERTEQIATDEATKLIADFAPTVDAATALVASSDGKATAEARTALQETIDSYTLAVTPLDDAPRIALPAGWVETNPLDYRQSVRDAQEIATPAIADASKIVTDEVTAWQVTEDARIAAEAEAARKAEEERRAAEQHSNSGGGNNNGGSSSNSGNGSGSSNGSSGGGNGGGSNGGGSSDGRAWAEGVIRSIAPGVGIQWGYGGRVYAGKFSRGSNTISLSDSIADRSGYAYSILVHEATHAGPQRGSCYDTWWGSHFNSDAERFVQAYTLNISGRRSMHTRIRRG